MKPPVIDVDDPEYAGPGATGSAPSITRRCSPKAIRTLRSLLSDE